MLKLCRDSVSVAVRAAVLLTVDERDGLLAVAREVVVDQVAEYLDSVKLILVELVIERMDSVTDCDELNVFDWVTPEVVLDGDVE